MERVRCTKKKKYSANKYYLNTAKEEISRPIKSAIESKIITGNEFEAMDPTDKKAGMFYQLFFLS